MSTRHAVLLSVECVCVCVVLNVRGGGLSKANGYWRGILPAGGKVGES